MKVFVGLIEYTDDSLDPEIIVATTEERVKVGLREALEEFCASYTDYDSEMWQYVTNEGAVEPSFKAWRQAVMEAADGAFITINEREVVS